MNRKRSDTKVVEAGLKRNADSSKVAEVLKKELTEAKNHPISKKAVSEVVKVAKVVETAETGLDDLKKLNLDKNGGLKIEDPDSKSEVEITSGKDSDVETVISAPLPKKTPSTPLESGMEYATTFASHKEQSATEDKLFALTPASKEYLEQLFQDKEELSRLASLTHTHFRHVIRLVDKEIKRVVDSLSAKVTEEAPENEEDLGRRILLSETIMVPVEKYPDYNFVGRILGPRGMTAKQLEEETGCKIMVRGRGSSRSFHGQRTRERNGSGEAEPLHVVIICEDYEKVANAKMNRAVEAINQILNPPPEGKDEFKRKQLVELSIINGTYRPTSGLRNGPNSPPNTGNGHLPTPVDYLPNSDSPRRLASYLENSRRLIGGAPTTALNALSSGDAVPKNSMEDQYTQMMALQWMNMQMSNPSFVYEYYKQLLGVAMSDPSLLNALLAQENVLPNGMQSSRHHSMSGGTQPGMVPPANLQQYMAAAAMLRSAPDSRDAAGDWDRNHQ